MKQFLLFCPCCGSSGHMLSSGSPQPRRFPFAAACVAKSCGLRTPYMASEELAAVVWNRRVTRKPPKRRLLGERIP